MTRVGPKYEIEQIVPYRVHYAQDSRLLASRGLAILRSDNGGTSFEEICRIPRAPGHRLLNVGNWAARLFRADIHWLVPTGDKQLIAFAGRRVFSINTQTGSIDADCELNGSRPLCVCTTNRAIYYGEYRGNPERTPVHIWESRDQGLTWQPVWEFAGIRHVHGVFEDPLDGSIWVTTGDENHESAIWRTTDGFSSLAKVVSDGQRSRAVALLFSEAALTYGTDIPDQKNAICQYDRRTGERIILRDVEGPVFFAARTSSHAFFSTVVEPSTTNLTKDVVIYASADWQNWHEALRLRKDRLPRVLFQYGQVRFAAGPGDGESIWISPLGTTYDQQSLRLTW